MLQVSEWAYFAVGLFGLAFELTMIWVMRRYFPWYRREGRGV